MSVESRRPSSRRPIQPPPTVIDPNQRYSLREAAAILRMGLPTLYRRMADSRINVIRDGGRTYVHGTELIRQSAPPAVSQQSAA